MHPKYTKNKAETLPMTAQKNYTPRPLSLLSANRFARRPKAFPKRPQDDPRGPGTSPNRAQDVPQEAPRRPFGGAKTVQASPRQPQRGTKRPPRDPRRAPRRSKTPQDVPRRPPRGSNTAQEEPILFQETQKGPQDCPETAHTAEDASKTRSRRQRLVPRRPEMAQLKLHRTKSS